MGVVYKARQSKLGRLVALKMILSGAHAGETDCARFRTEAEAIARLQHPNIIQIYEVGEHDGLPFFSLEFCGGGSLDAKLNSTPLPAKEAARLVETLAQAIHAAHQKGVVHRDLKPANVLLAEDGTPKITDFGLARKLDEVGRTAEGSVMGTPSYMAPEQARGKSEEIGPLADVWALGAILYECLTGKPPFRAATPMDTILQVMTEEPVPPARLQSRTPRDLETICLKCLRKEAKKRYSSAQELAEDLHRFLADEPIQARPMGRGERVVRWCRKYPSRALACVLAALMLVAAIVVPARLVVVETHNARMLAAEHDKTVTALEAARAAEQRALRQAAEATLDRAQAEGAQGEVARGVLLLARGLETAEQAQAANLVDAYRWNFDAWARELHPLQFMVEHPGLIAGLAVHPGGELFATACHDGKLRLLRVADGLPAQEPFDLGSPVTAVAFAPDGTLLLATAEDGLARLWDREQKGLWRLRRQFAVGKEPLAVAFHPGGKSVAIGGGSATSARAGVARLWDIDSGRPAGPELTHDRPVAALAWGPVPAGGGAPQLFTGEKNGEQVYVWDAMEGHLLRRIPVGLHDRLPSPADICLAVHGSRLLVGDRSSDFGRQFDTQTGKEIGKSFKHRNSVTGVAFSPDGRLALTGSYDRTVRLWDVDTGEQVGPPLLHRNLLVGVAFGPRGQTVTVFTVTRKSARLWRLSRGSLLHQLPRSWEVPGLAFSADGRHLFTAEQRALQCWDVTTGKAARSPLTLRHEVSGLEGTCSLSLLSDGKRLAVGLPHPAQVVVHDLEAGQLLTASPALATQSGLVVVSPDGRTLASGSEGPKSTAGQLWDVATGKPIGPPLQHKGAIRGLAFSPDSQWLLTGSFNSTFRLWSAATGTPLGKPIRVDGEVWTVDFSHDGRLALSAGSARTVQLWDTADWTKHGVPMLNPATIAVARFEPEGRLITAGGYNQSVRLWHILSGKQVGPDLPHAAPVVAVAWSRDSKHFASAARDGKVKLWRAPTPARGSPAELLDHARLLTGMDLDDRGGFQMLNGDELNRLPKAR
jgi:WD40 repeat protein/tRNA A-37 threonylcarbamoyl transferase component Bud32